MIATRPSKAAIVAAALLGLVGLTTVASAQEPPSHAAMAIKMRTSTMTVLANEFGPLGAMAAGKMPFDAAKVQLNAPRVVTLASIATEVFPPDSKDGAPTKAKAEIWTDQATFNGLMKDLQDKAAALAIAAKVGSLDALKPAVADVGKACKACHDKFKEK